MRKLTWYGKSWLSTPVIILMWCMLASPLKDEPAIFSALNYFFLALTAFVEIFCITMRFKEKKDVHWRDTDPIFPFYKSPVD